VAPDHPPADRSEPRSQGLELEVGPLPEVALAQLVPGADAGPGLIVALDGVEDPQNVGSIARVADAAGAQGLVLTDRRSPPLGAAVSRASAGAIEWLPVARVPNLRRALDTLKKEGFWVFGCDSEDGEDVFGLSDRVVSGHRVVVLGAEGAGLREGTWKLVDHRVRIPMQGRVGSLNVASAASIVLFELQRRTRPSGESGQPVSDRKIRG
jgi:23S rRNA (guanosine2251-2'-O)-methyltransferase